MTCMFVLGGEGVHSILIGKTEFRDSLAWLTTNFNKYCLVTFFIFHKILQKKLKKQLHWLFFSSSLGKKKKKSFSVVQKDYEIYACFPLFYSNFKIP